MLITILVACGGGQAGGAGDVAFDATRSGSSARSVQAALDELYVRCAAKPEGASTAPVTTSDAGLAARVQALELKVNRLENEGITDAERITYDPRQTTLAGRNVQAAVTELEGRVQALERVDQGQPGPALFELRDKHGNLVGGSGGPQGPPPGGQGGPPGQPGQPGQPGKGGPPGKPVSGPPPGGGQMGAPQGAPGGK